jgi:hypothetical protein
VEQQMLVTRLDRPLFDQLLRPPLPFHRSTSPACARHADIPWNAEVDDPRQSSWVVHDHHGILGRRRDEGGASSQPVMASASAYSRGAPDMLHVLAF